MKGKEGTDIEKLALGSADTFSYVNNIRVTKFNDDGSVEGELTVTPQSLNALGIVHGGCMATLADAVAGHAANRHGRCVTVNYAFNFLRPAKGTNKKIHCIALPEKVGQTLCIYHISLTDDQGLAAGIGIAVILFNYYSVRLSEHVSSTAAGTAVALLVLILAVGAVVRYLTKNEDLAFAVCLVLLATASILYFVDSAAYEGLLPDLMKALSLFERFTVFVNGVFDLTGLVYYLSVIVFFLFLSVQSLEKRRYN